MSPDTVVPEWADRLQRVERKNQRLTGIVVLLLLVAVTQTVWHLMPGPPVLSAEHILLRRGNQPARAQFYLWQDGTPALRFNNPKGEARAMWAIRPDGTISLRMSDRYFATRVEMLVDPEGLPRFSVYGADGKPRGTLSVNPDGRADLTGFQGR